MVSMNFNIDLQNNIIGTYIILPFLGKQEIRLTDCNTIQKTKPNFFNASYSKIITIRPRQPLVHFTTFNEGTENFDVNFETFDNSNIKSDNFCIKCKTLGKTVT